MKKDSVALKIKTKKVALKEQRIISKLVASLLVVLITLIFLRFHNLLINLDDYLTWTFGWVRITFYLMIIICAIKTIVKQRLLISYQEIILSSIIILILCYFAGNIFEILHQSKINFWTRVPINKLGNKINYYNQLYQNYINVNNSKSKLIFFVLPWLDCQAGMVGVLIVYIANTINILFTTITSFCLLIFLISYLICHQPFIVVQKLGYYFFKLLAFFTFYHFITSKISKLFFSITYSFLRLRQKIFSYFKKSHYKVYSNDKSFLRFFKTHITINFAEIFNNVEFYKKRWNWMRKKNDFQGIYAFYVTNFYGKEKVFLPCYIGKSNNITTRWKSHGEKIKWAYENPHELDKTLAVYQRISSYLHANNLSPTDLNFIVLEWVVNPKNLSKAEAYWINKISTTQRGWNSIRSQELN